MSFEDHYQVLYGNGAPTEPIRLGQLLVDESYSPPKLMKCTSLSPLVYTEVGAGGGGTVTQVDTGTGLTGGPITTTGTVELDSASIASLALADTAVQPARTISTTAPLTGGGALSSDLTLAANQFSSTASGIVPASGGGSFNYLRADGTWNIPPGAAFPANDPTIGVEVYEDFLGAREAFTTTGIFWVPGMSSLWYGRISNGGSISASNGGVGHPGVYVVSTGTTTGTSNGLLSYSNPASLSPIGGFLLGGGELVFYALIYIDTLFSGPNTGQMRIGLMDEISGAPGAGVYANYDSSTAGWQFVTRDSGGSSFSAAGTTITAGAWHKVHIVVNAAASSAVLYIDGVLQATNTAFIPTTEGVNFGFMVQKTAGTTPAIIRCDYIHIYQTLTTPR